MSSNQGQGQAPGGGGEQELPTMDGSMSSKKRAPPTPGVPVAAGLPPSTDKPGEVDKKGQHRPGTNQEVRKPRHTTRRMRFRHQMFQTSKHLNILEENDNEDDFTEFGATVMSSKMSTGWGGGGDDGFSKFSLGSSLYTHKEGGGGGCSPVKMLLCALCLILVGGGVGAVLFFTGALGGSSTETTTTTEVTIENTTTAIAPSEEIAAVTAIPVPTSTNSHNQALYEGIDFTTFDPAVMADGTPLLPLEDLLPPFTLQTLQESAVATPQSLALQWVRGHPSYESMPNWKKLQLMALASFYYAFNGQEWPADKSKNWLSYEVDECDWGDQGVDGQYMGVGCTDPATAATGSPFLGEATAATPPSVAKSTTEGVDAAAIKPEHNRRYTDLNLDWFLGIGNIGFANALEDITQMGGKANQIPPEVVFLQHLETLGCMNCGLKASLEGLVPPTLLQLPHLKRLSYRFNNIVGTLPTHLGQLSSLEYLSLGSNFLTGTLPSSLGGLTDVRELFLYSNQLEGSIPYGWNKLTRMIEFSAISNELTGTIPSFVADWQDLEFFFIDHNPLKGTMPSEICSLANLTSFLLPCSVGCAMECGETCECYEN